MFNGWRTHSTLMYTDGRARRHTAWYCLIRHLAQSRETLLVLYEMTWRSRLLYETSAVHFFVISTSYTINYSQNSRLPRYATSATLTKLSDTRLTSTLDKLCLLTDHKREWPDCTHYERTAPPAKFQPKTFVLLVVIYTMLDTVRVLGNWNGNTVSLAQVMVAPNNTWGNEKTDRDCNTKNANHCREQGGIHENDRHIIGKFLQQHVVRHVRNQRPTIYFPSMVWLWSSCRHSRAASTHTAKFCCKVLEHTEQTKGT